MTLQTGEVLNNRYRIVKLIGQGGFGAVYRAWDTAVNQPCAVKENLGTSPQAQQQFKREATMMAGLRHPNLPRVTDHFFIPNQGQYLVMDFVQGQSLDDLLEQNGTVLDERQVLPWIDQVCAALEYLHNQNPPIIHRDIKPQNIIITPVGQAMLVDFGISKVYDPHLKTTTGALACTPGFSPPEQHGMGRTDGRSDIYALGATLYNLLTNQLPPNSIDRLVHGILLMEPRQLNPLIQSSTEQALLKAMQVNSRDRFQEVADLRRALLAPALVQTTPPPSLAPSSAVRPIPAVATQWVVCPKCQFTNRTSAVKCKNCNYQLAPRYEGLSASAQPGTNSEPKGGPIGCPKGVTTIAWFCILPGILTIVGGIAGIGMLKGKNWARRLGIFYLAILTLASGARWISLSLSDFDYGPGFGHYLVTQVIAPSAPLVLLVGVLLYSIIYLLSAPVKDFFYPFNAPLKPDPLAALVWIGWGHIIFGILVILGWFLPYYSPIFIVEPFGNIVIASLVVVITVLVGIGLLRWRRKWLWWVAIGELTLLCSGALLASVVYLTAFFAQRVRLGSISALGFILLLQVWFYLFHKNVRQAFP